MALNTNTQVPPNPSADTSTKKITIIAVLVLALLVAVWLVFKFSSRQEPAVNPEEVLTQLTLGDTDSDQQITVPDSSRDSAISYRVATNQDVASELGINSVKSKQEIIDFYTNWLGDNGWNILVSRQVDERNSYVLTARKEDAGLLQITINSPGGEEGGTEDPGVLDVSVVYGYGR